MNEEIKAAPKQEAKLKELLKATNEPREIKRIQSVYLKIKYGFSKAKIADIVGYHPDHVKRIQANYRKYGEESLKLKPKGGRNKENMSIEEEKKLLSGFTDKAVEGGILEVTQVKDAYEKKIGKDVHDSTIYRMLARHGWRKIAPRPHHPKNDKEAIAGFKKTFTT